MITLGFLLKKLIEQGQTHENSFNAPVFVCDIGNSKDRDFQRLEYEDIEVINEGGAIILKVNQ